VKVRPESIRDIEAIGAVTRAAFGKDREARMVEEIRRSDSFVPDLSLVAEVEGEIVGHAMLSYVRLEEAGRRVLELGPMSVRPNNQRQGVGSALIREAIRVAEERGEPMILVLGHATYYPRFGFRPASELGITPPDSNIPDEVFMALPLTAYDPRLRGRVVFPSAYSIEP
jgi:putative acetyltransferase